MNTKKFFFFDICKEFFDLMHSPYIYYEYEEKKEEVSSVLFSCSHCNKTYKSKPGLAYHLDKCPKVISDLEEKEELKESECKETFSSIDCPHCQKECKTQGGLSRHLHKCIKKPKPQPPVRLEVHPQISPVEVSHSSHAIDSLQRENQRKDRELSSATNESNRLRESLFEREKDIYELQKKVRYFEEKNYDLLYPRLEEKNKKLTEENYKLRREIEDLKYENEDLRDELRHDKKMFTDMMSQSIDKQSTAVVNRGNEHVTTRNNNNKFTIQIFDGELSRKIQNDPIAGCNEINDLVNKIMAQCGLSNVTGMGLPGMNRTQENLDMDEMGNNISNLMNSIFNNSNNPCPDMTGVSGSVRNTSNKKYDYRFV
jgi:predicted nuclease with TOPRIM domain